MQELTKEEIQKYHNELRTEEVQHIIDRMPTKFGSIVTIVILSIVGLMIFFGCIIRYPDVVTGQITLNTPISPLKLVANASGKLHLRNHHTMDKVVDGGVVAYIENATSFDTLERIHHLATQYNPAGNDIVRLLDSLPDKPQLGELSSKYYAFLNALWQLKTFLDDRLYEKQVEGLQKLLTVQQQSIANSRQRIGLSNANMGLSEKLYKRDSLLYKQKALAEGELDQTQISFISSKDNHRSQEGNYISNQKEARATVTQIEQTNIQKTEKEKELKNAVVTAYNDLKDNIAIWEQNYVFKAPFDGQLEFLGFWTDGQYIQSGQPVFTIIPANKNVYGQMLLPTAGAGKVDTGQEVIVKLNNFPYMEYGSIKGKVKSISTATNETKTTDGTTDTYLATVVFEKGLTTNYGSKIPYKQEAKGTGDIITKDRKLIQRFFDNLKYVTNK